MKITKLFGVLALCLAMTLVAACWEGGQLYDDPQAGIDEGEPVSIEAGGEGGTLSTEQGDPFCAPNAFLPAGMDAYVQINPNGPFDRRIPFVYNFLRDVMYDAEYPDLMAFAEYAVGSEQSNIFAILRSNFDDKLRQAAGIGLRDIDCISLAIQTKTGDYCQGGDVPCFNKFSTVQQNLDKIPYIGPYLTQLMMLFPVQFRELFGVFQTIQIPDPLVLFQELTSGDVEIMMAMDWEPGALVKSKDFMEWVQEAMDPDSNLNLPPEFSLIKASTPTIRWGAIEGYEGCFSATLSPNPSGVAPAVVGDGGDVNLVLWACEAGDYLLLASSEYGMNELLGQYELAQQNITAGSFMNDPAYKQTYKALWDGSVAMPDLLVAWKFAQLQDDLVGRINAREDTKLDPGLGPFTRFLPMMNDDIDMFTVGMGVTLDHKSKINVTLQLNDIASLDNPLYTLGKQISGNGEIEGYYDYRFGFTADASSTAIDSIAMDFYLSADQLGMPMDGYNAAAAMLLTIEETILDAYLDSLER